MVSNRRHWFMHEASDGRLPDEFYLYVVLL